MLTEHPSLFSQSLFPSLAFPFPFFFISDPTQMSHTHTYLQSILCHVRCPVQCLTTKLKLKKKTWDACFNTRSTAAILGYVWLCNSVAWRVATNHSNPVCVFQHCGQLGGQRHRTSCSAAAKRVRGAASSHRWKQLDTSCIHAPHEVLSGEDSVL